MNAQELGQRLIDATSLIPNFRPSQHQKFVIILVVLKRLSDCFQEELGEIREDDPDLFTSYVPAEARWPEIRRHTANLGDVLNRATLVLEEHRPSLRSFLRWCDFNNRQEMAPEVLERLLQHFDAVHLGQTTVPATVVGEGFIHLIDHLASLEARETADRMTPPDLNRLLAELLAPYPKGCRVYDPACGTASSLIACGQALGHGDLSLWGQEINLESWRIAKVNLFLHEMAGGMEYGDTLKAPAVTDGGALRRFERIVCHPTFSLKAGEDWGTADAPDDPYHRFTWAVPPKQRVESAFLLHILTSLAEGSKVAAILSQGVLFRSGSEAAIRQRLVQEELLEAVIGLPEGVFYSGKAKGGARAVVLVLNRAKTPERQGKVLFVDGSHGYLEDPKRNRLRKEDIGRLASAYRGFADVDGLARVVAKDEIVTNGFNLSISRYIAQALAGDELAAEDVLEDLVTLRDERARLEQDLQKLAEVMEV